MLHQNFQPIPGNTTQFSLNGVGRWRRVGWDVYQRLDAPQPGEPEWAQGGYVRVEDRPKTEHYY